MFVLSRRFTFASVCLFVLAGIAYTLPNTSIHGTVTDPSGAAVPNAKVELLETKNDHETLVATVMTNANGEYVFERTPASVSRLLVSAPGFRTVEQSISVEVDTHDVLLNIRLPLALFSEQITVTSTGTATPQSQLGAAVTTLSEQDYAGTRDI